MTFYSQDGQDKYIADLLQNKREGVFVDIGAYDGVTFSNTLVFEKELGWTGICVEPNPVAFEKLAEERNCICLNYCINDKEGTFKFLAVKGWGVMLSGLLDFFDQKHLDRIDRTIEEHGGSKSVIEIPALPMHEIFRRNSIKNVDYCNIDVEGGEMSVLKSIDFSAVTIKLFTIENNYNTTVVSDFLKEHGYSLIGKVGADDVFELHSKRYMQLLKLQLKSILGNVKKMIKRIIKK